MTSNHWAFDGDKWATMIAEAKTVGAMLRSADMERWAKRTFRLIRRSIRRGLNYIDLAPCPGRPYDWSIDFLTSKGLYVTGYPYEITVHLKDLWV